MYRVIAVTNRKLSRRPFLEQVEIIAQKKPKAIMLREKDLSAKEYQSLAKDVLFICQNNKVELILHHYPEVAKDLGVKEIHLSLMRLKEYKKELKKDFSKVGCSVHSLEEAREAVLLGADYLTAGHIYDTDCKRGLPGRGIPFLEEICENITIPVYAIGGIGFTNGRIEEVMAHGASGACVMSEIMKL